MLSWLLRGGHKPIFSFLLILSNHFSQFDWPSTSSRSFLVCHVSTSFGEVEKTPPWRRKRGRNEGTGCGGVWWVPQSYQETGRVSFLRFDGTKDELFTFLSAIAGAVLPKRDKGAGNHWCWSSYLTSRTKRWKTKRQRGNSFPELTDFFATLTTTPVGIRNDTVLIEPTVNRSDWTDLTEIRTAVNWVVVVSDFKAV